MSISALIETFRMEEIEKKTRAKVIVRLGEAINHTYGNNICEPLVYELVKILDPENEILKNERYMVMANVK